MPAIIFYRCPIEFEPETFQWIDRPRHLCALIDGKDADPDRVWETGREIPEAEYRYLIEGAAWDRVYAPQSPAANPARAIDLNTMPSLF